ncbi:MAG: hypothetical protein ACRERE_23960 [Candidatus Entotheonellia bacterium]
MDRRSLSGKTRKGNRFLRTTLGQAAHAAARTKGTYLSAQYRRLAARQEARDSGRGPLDAGHGLLHDPSSGALAAKPGPTCLTGCSRRTLLGDSSNAWNSLATT